ncbi:LysE/ArgO family amino acid transporter [Gorillibacterium massiliense]|uniref:LysE/ArgO family amino acid transporter n=1 Tax=Gorillibacterium massiliense TaxID=1280390 RepID=UPI0004B0BC28|nr:LysE family translocator [Gorillibacterium massiliense]
MMEESWIRILKGILLGFSIAAPVGPIGIYCIRQTLTRGRRTGFVAGLGAATADATYGMLAGIGIGVSARLLQHIGPILQLLGGLFLIYIGFKTGKTVRREDAKGAGLDPAADTSIKSFSPMMKTYLTTLLLTLANPATILSFLGFFTAAGISASAANPQSALFFVAGVFLGSALWWLILSTTTGFLRGKIMNTAALATINGISAFVLAGFGIWAIWNGASGFL